jgi:hypothetical protein
MKIQDLLEAPFATDVIDKRAKRNLDGFSQRKRDNPAGGFSMVKPDKDPHMMKKSSLRAMPDYQREGFKEFIMFLHNNKFENIHFPRVYEVTTIQGKDGYVIDKYKVERLIEGHKVDRQLMRNYVVSLCGEEAMEDWHDEGAYRLLAAMIMQAVDYDERPFTADSLNDACAIVARAIRAIGGTNDLGTDANIMYRQTPHGIQVVLNDPIFIQSR